MLTSDLFSNVIKILLFQGYEIGERIDAESESVDEIRRLVVAFCRKNHIEDAVEILMKL